MDVFIREEVLDEHGPITFVIEVCRKIGIIKITGHFKYDW